jgi:hypothetical protein
MVDVGVVVSRDECDVVTRTDLGKPLRHLLKLAGKTDVCQVTGYDSMIRVGAVQVVQKSLKNFGTVFVALETSPGPVTEKAFVEKVAGASQNRRREMGIGQMCELKHVGRCP